MNKKLAIVGNGFDLAHDLKTNYSDFSKKLPKDLKEKWEFFLGEFQVETSDWYSFENAIGKLTEKWHKQFFGKYEKGESLEREELKEKIEQINQLYNSITFCLFDYISNENKKNVDLNYLVSKEISKDSYVISFNYTNLIEKYSDLVYYIHGSIDEGYIVLGYKNKEEHTGIMPEATKYDKKKLREFLNFRRYLKKQGIHQKTFYSELNDFEKHITCMFSNKGGYEIKYTEETDRRICDVVNNYYETHGSNNNSFNYFTKFPSGPDLTDKLEAVARSERLNSISSSINEYGEINHFCPAIIKTHIPFTEIEELVILGHSLIADIEILEALFEVLTNLKKITLFTYKGENYSDKINMLKNLLKCPIDIKAYE